MWKRVIFIFIMIFVVFFILGYTIQNNMSTKNNINNTRTGQNGINLVDQTQTIEVNSSDEKTTPNTIMILKKKYTDCGHEISSRAGIPEEMVNLTKEEIIEKYPNWKLEVFSKEQIVLSKEVNSFCGEHYLLIEENGEINLYSIDEAGERSFKRRLDIAVEYLTETDNITLKNGLMVYGTENLNKIIEDYEA